MDGSSRTARAGGGELGPLANVAGKRANSASRGKLETKEEVLPGCGSPADDAPPVEPPDVVGGVASMVAACRFGELGRAREQLDGEIRVGFAVDDGVVRPRCDIEGEGSHDVLG